MPTDPIDRRIVVVIFASLWVTYAFIGPGFMVINPNTVSRMGYVLNLLQQHVANIDLFSPLTVDKAQVAGHFYLDKAPGLSLMALPFVAAATAATDLLGFSTAPLADGYVTLFYTLVTCLAVAVTTAPFTAAAAAALFVVARRTGASRGGACFAALVFALATPAFGWATVFLSHSVAGACLFLALATIVLGSDPAAPPRHDLRAGALAGALLSWAVVVEFTAAAPALLIAVFALWRLAQLPGARRRRIALGAMIAGLAAAVPLGIYNQMVFGAVTHLGYSDVVGFEGMQQGIFGVSLPRGDIALALLAGTKRGLLWLSPVLLAVPVAWAVARKRLPGPLLAVAVAVPLVLLAINSGYAYWDGGASTGPRHLVPALPFLALALAPLWDRAPLAGRAALLTLAVPSAAISVLCATTAMGAPIWENNPLPDYLWPRFASGDTHHMLALTGFAGHAWLLALPIPWYIAARRTGLLTPPRRVAESPAPA